MSTFSMKLEDKIEDNQRPPITRLIGVFLGSMVSIFGLLLLTMLELEDFSRSAFEYWTPRALAVVVATTVLGLPVRNKGTAVRFVYGFFVSLALALIYVWVT
jgi:hypothetical protein